MAICCVMSVCCCFPVILLFGRYEWVLLFFPDFDSIWFVDMDPHSLVPPQFEAGEGVLIVSQSVPSSDPYVSSSGVGRHSVVSVQGRLKNCVSFWEDQLEASEFVMGIIRSGYRLPFIRLPPSVCMKNHQSAVRNAQFVSQSIQDLLYGNCVIECVTCPLVCSPLQVVTGAKGKQRLVIDLRYVNQYLHQHKFRYEGLNVLPSLFHQGDFMITFDLKSGYHHVDINQDCWPYLGFSWKDPRGIRHFYTFRVLPFGLSTACYVFTKLLRPLVKHWRSHGRRAIVYIDDGICAASNVWEAEQHSAAIQSDLTKAGFVLNLDKSRLVPHQVGEWLGFTIDLATGCYRVPEEKIAKLKSSVVNLSDSLRVPIRAVASIVGQVMSMSLALGPIARLRTRALYADINNCTSWYAYVTLSDEAKDELLFWQSNIVSLNSQPIWFESGATRVVYSDASDSGYGGYTIEVGPQISHGAWSEHEAQWSSTWRELKAVYEVLRSLAPTLRGHTIKWFSDNQNVTRIVHTGSRRQHLQEGAIAIYDVCFQHGIKLEMEWIPRSENEIADYISRIQDTDDWMIDPYLFMSVDMMWGPHTIDCFASAYNHQLEKFHSRFWCPGTLAVDTFTVSWEGEVCWLVPPLHLISRVLKHAEHCHALGTLVVPLWKSAVFWPLLCPDGIHLAPFIHAWFLQPYYDGLLQAGRSGANLGDSLTDESMLLLLTFDFTRQFRSSHFGFCLSDRGYCPVCYTQ